MRFYFDYRPPKSVMFNHLSAVTDMLLNESKEIVLISGIINSYIPKIYPVRAKCPIKASEWALTIITFRCDLEDLVLIRSIVISIFLWNTVLSSG